MVQVKFDEKDKLEPSKPKIVRFALKAGVNKIRVLDSVAEMFYQHYFESSPNHKYVTCSKLEHNSCAACQTGNVPSQKFMFNILDLEERKIKLWTINKKSMKILMDLEEAAGKLNTYDLTINCDNPKYQSISSIIPVKDSKIKMEIIERFKDNPNRYKIEELSKSLVPKEIEKILHKSLNPKEQIYDESLSQDDEDDLQKFLAGNEDKKESKKPDNKKEEVKEKKEEKKEEKKSTVEASDIDSFFESASSK